jgi:hypothetical protein
MQQYLWVRLMRKEKRQMHVETLQATKLPHGLKLEFSYLNQEPRILPISGPHWQHPPHTAVLILEIPDV